MSTQQTDYNIQWMKWFAERNAVGLYLSDNSDFHYYGLRKEVAQTLGTQFKTVTNDDINYVFEHCTEMATDIILDGGISRWPKSTRYAIQHQRINSSSLN